MWWIRWRSKCGDIQVVNPETGKTEKIWYLSSNLLAVGYDYSSIEDVEQRNDNFLSWIEEVMIEWNLEDHNYDVADR
ncbi:hypothetical protein [Sphingobacterium sp.]|uniref:hypothetical protein n=1 Tax=Sphingobacterium sp. TaxID=341027 RepID=UPI00289D312A|nr:hypothetical protein [Sphingobacterium sp.]